MHEVVFDTSELPSGKYLYRLETAQGSFVWTMLLAKKTITEVSVATGATFVRE